MFDAVMATSIRLSLSLLACLLVLDGCAHSRVVQREYPPESARAHTRVARTPASPSSRAASAAIPLGAVHVVRAGETLYGISFRYGLRYQDVANWNGIGEPYTIEIGQRLRLQGPQAVAQNSRSGAALPPSSRVTASTTSTPRSTTGAAIVPAPTASAASSVAATPSSPTAAVPIRSIPNETPETRSPTTAAATSSASTLPPTQATARPGDSVVSPVVGAPAWRWPVKGQIIGRYVSGDQTQQGINIAGSAGQNIAAAADGIVVYSGAGLVGYGELIIIKHSEEWLSAYAHNRRRLVGEGTRVRAGEVIAEMGRTGASRDMLHFEIRRNGKPVDPLSQLPRP
jgi:lipoprotein NlpD